MQSVLTAGIIIIGDEILSGKVRDSNSYYLASELRDLGVVVKQISVIADEIEGIGREVADFSDRFDYVFTSGGVGPTHDDITMAGIAKGFGVSLVRHEGLKELLAARCKDQMNEAVLKMTEVPEGTEIEFHDGMRFPVLSFRNIYIFPGIPEYMQNKFSMIKEKFRSSVFHLKRLYLDCHESHIAALLSDIVKKYSEVAFGSYPVLGQQDYKVIVTAETKSEDSLNTALNDLLQRLPERVLVRVE